MSKKSQKSEECLLWGGEYAPGRGGMKQLWEMFSFYFLNFKVYTVEKSTVKK